MMPRNVSFNLSYRVASRRNSFNLPISRSILLGPKTTAMRERTAQLSTCRSPVVSCSFRVRLPIQSPPFSPIDSIGNHRPDVPTPVAISYNIKLPNTSAEPNASCLGNLRCGPLYGSSGTADSPSANLAVGCQLRSWLRCTNIRTTAGATTTPALTLAQVRRLCGNRQPPMLRSGASFEPGSGAQTSAQLPKPRQRQLRPWLRRGGSAAIRQPRILRLAPASTLAHAQAHKHPHNCRSHDNASFDPGTGEAALRRFANLESCE